MLLLLVLLMVTLVLLLRETFLLDVVILGAGRVLFWVLGLFSGRDGSLRREMTVSPGRLCTHELLKTTVSYV